MTDAVSERVLCKMINEAIKWYKSLFDEFQSSSSEKSESKKKSEAENEAQKAENQLKEKSEIIAVEEKHSKLQIIF
ncbi:hypothetical protein PRK78_000809 [Emydomyces testavorans]|uniref:Uncharacterized protein n=1 Tax=Emydomyces testavorans TaxID=2070801 RepID=A0AAF0II03_9EURO|nr:hypothetical protein PRK78_000809 [Emydomyces testavorans]